MKNQTPFSLCLIGGLFLILSHFAGGTGTILFVGGLLNSIPALAPYLFIINPILLVLFLIAWSGGFAVILGGYLLTTSHVRLGKFIIALAAGFGLISLILVILLFIITFGFAGLLLLTWLVINTPWAVGLVLTIIARRMAK